MRITEIILKLKNEDQLFLSPESIFYGKRILNPDAEEYIIDEAKMASSITHFVLKLQLSGEAIRDEQEMERGVQRHFAYRKNKSKMQLKKALQTGMQSLLIAVLFLGLLVTLVLVIIKLLPEGSLSITFRELLIILGWVALGGRQTCSCTNGAHSDGNSGCSAGLKNAGWKYG